MKYLIKEAEILKSTVGHHAETVGVKFYKTIPQNGLREIDNHRFCQVIMGARKGEDLLLMSKWEEVPDVIVIEDEVEKLMRIALTYLNEEGGRLNFSRSILQAMSVDSTILLFKSGKINIIFGCYGYRDATDAQSGEAILGMPANKLNMVVEYLSYLKLKAIDRSRAKNIFMVLEKRISISEK